MTTSAASSSPPTFSTSHRTILDHVGKTPLVMLSRIVKNSGVRTRVPIFAKCEHLNPGGSVKDRIAVAIVDDAERRGLLHQGATLIEATAGNTGLGLALVAALRGYALVCVLPEKMSIDKRAALKAVGAQVIVTPNAPPSHPDNFQNVARRLATDNGWFLTDQFANPVNVAVHEETTAPEIVAQIGEAHLETGEKIGAFVAGVGTGGTITGVGRFLKRVRPNARIVLADPIGSGLAQWVKTGELGPDASYQVEGIGSSKPPDILDRTVIDDVESVSDEESFAMARRLIREEGLLVGGSAGTAVVAAVRVAAKLDPDAGPVVVLLPDSWDRYLSRDWLTAT